ncbi:unannotated protein [freshwater metagenome]|uniref:Unannotated protein n=1 Tax=freshwater metagenome TaxID=449393 RepID=A0A6J7Q5X5_9ZZZZ
MRLRSESKGSSAARGALIRSDATSIPASCAATRRAVSVGSPIVVTSPSSVTRRSASLQRAPAVSASRAVGCCPVMSSRSPRTCLCPEPSSTVTVMRFWVSVPVLSEQITVTEPRVSTAGSLRTRALRLSIRCEPIARVSVTTAGRPSGITATAALIAVSMRSPQDSPPMRPMMMRITATTSPAAANCFPTRSRRSCSGV